jgi:hypothetical protein
VQAAGDEDERGDPDEAEPRGGGAVASEELVQPFDAGE